MKKIFKEEEMKYEKNKDFPILRDFKEENSMKIYLRKKIFIKKMKMIIIIILLKILMIIMIMTIIMIILIIIIMEMKMKKKIKNMKET